MTGLQIAWVEPGTPLPDPSRALDDPPGLLAAGRDLGVARLVEAYSSGTFPWYSDKQPVLWWSPDPRMVLVPAEFRLSRSLRQRCRRMQRSGAWTVTLDTAFDDVVAACAKAVRHKQSGTWITPQMRRAYGGLHRAGFAHSVEIWRHGADGRQLAGGLYGVAIGRMFFGESMFSREADASKAALAALVDLLGRHGYPVIDCQQATAHLASLGAREIPRSAFVQLVREQTRQSAPDWREMVIELPLA
ncbi:MAG: leucyl/phenylalanyl-tRNA--protein transferase [Burkholderiaceae bacterium]